MLIPYRPRICFQREKFKQLFSFGKWVAGSSILLFAITKGDDIFVGKMMGMSALGFYQMAYLISNMPATEISHLISQVTFPAYSLIQENLKRLREAFSNVLQVTAFLIFPLAGGIILFARDFTKLCLGDQWLPIIPVMQVLALAGLFRSISATTGPIFQGMGKPEIITKWQPVRFVVLFILIYPLTLKFGILGTSVAVFSGNLISGIGFCIKAARHLELEVKIFIAKLILPLINTIIASLLIFIIKLQVTDFGIRELFVFVCLKILLYILLTYIFNRTSLLILVNRIRFAQS
jgi:O-antigen/teichoic acid export membrane protein